MEIHYHSADELDRVYQLIVEAGKKRTHTDADSLVCRRHNCLRQTLVSADKSCADNNVCRES